MLTKRLRQPPKQATLRRGTITPNQLWAWRTGFWVEAHRYGQGDAGRCRVCCVFAVGS